MIFIEYMKEEELDTISDIMVQYDIPMILNFKESEYMIYLNIGLKICVKR